MQHGLRSQDDWDCPVCGKTDCICVQESAPKRKKQKDMQGVCDWNMRGRSAPMSPGPPGIPSPMSPGFGRVPSPMSPRPPMPPKPRPPAWASVSSSSWAQRPGDWSSSEPSQWHGPRHWAGDQACAGCEKLKERIRGQQEFIERNESRAYWDKKFLKDEVTEATGDVTRSLRKYNRLEDECSAIEAECEAMDGNMSEMRSEFVKD